MIIEQNSLWSKSYEDKQVREVHQRTTSYTRPTLKRARLPPPQSGSPNNRHFSIDILQTFNRSRQDYFIKKINQSAQFPHQSYSVVFVRFVGCKIEIQDKQGEIKIHLFVDWNSKLAKLRYHIRHKATTREMVVENRMSWTDQKLKPFVVSLRVSEIIKNHTFIAVVKN